MGSSSVKTKVAAVVTAFAVVLAAVVFCVVLTIVGSQTASNTETQLKATNARLLSELIVDDGMVYADDSAFVQDATYSAVYDTEGHFLCGYMPSADLDSVEFKAEEVQSVDSWIVFDAEYRLNGYGKVHVRSVTDTQGTEGIMSTLWILAAGGVVTIAVMTALGSYLIMRRFLRPLDTMTSTAASISSGTDLSRRIELPETRDEFHALGTTFNDMFDRLTESFEKERRFTNNASHELRTPVAVILSESEYILEDQPSQEEQLEAVGKIQKHAAKMSGLIGQLLMLARADRGAVVIQQDSVDLSELMDLVSETGMEIAVKRNITVNADIQPGVRVTGDEALLMRMALNLVENAVRYGRDDGEMNVSLRSEGGYAVGVVSDNGIGIGPNDLPHIWERFYQADVARTGEDKGSGLGLSMVKFIAEAHGGSIECDSELGVGSTFTFKIPLEAREL